MYTLVYGYFMYVTVIFVLLLYELHAVYMYSILIQYEKIII